MLYFFAYPLLWLLAKLYGVVVYLRNKAYTEGWLHRYKAPFPVICVGNLSVGGTGKTPMVAYCADRLLPQLPKGSCYLLSRGYMRQTSGLLSLRPEHRPERSRR